jgi:hypothetical protein
MEKRIYLFIELRPGGKKRYSILNDNEVEKFAVK